MGKESKKQNNKPQGLPVGLYSLGEEDSEFWHVDKKGRKARVMIEDVDGDKFYFSNTNVDGNVTVKAVDKAWEFIRIHGLRAVSDEELNRIRESEAPDIPDTGDDNP